jgi:hypothetical protein
MFSFVSKALSSHDDLLLGLTPLFWPIAEKFAGNLFDNRQFAEVVRDTYGISMTTDVAEEFIPRLVQSRLLKTNIESSTHGIYTWVRPAQSPEHEQDLNNNVDIIEQIGSEFREYVNTFPTLFTITLRGDELTDLLFDWLISNDSALRNASHTLENFGEDGSENEKSSGSYAKKPYQREGDYLCAKFVTHLKKAKPVLFDHIAQISSAVLLSEVILEIKTPKHKMEALKDFTVFLDGPFVMDILGLSGLERHQNAKYIFSKIVTFGARMYVFSHSLEEIRSNLSGVLNRPAHLRTGPTGDAIRQNAVSEDYARAVMNGPETFVETAGMQILDARIGVSVADGRYFDETVMSQFGDELRGWSNDMARKRDAQSVAGIMRRRRGRQNRDVFKLSHVLLSHNPGLCRIAHRFCVDEGLIAPDQIGPAIHQRKIAALVWITAGTDERLEISRRQLVANCAVAVRSRPDVIDAMRAKLAEVRPELKEQFDALLSRPRSVQLAMDLTLASENAVKENNIESVFEMIKDSVAEKEREVFGEKMNTAREKFGQQLGIKQMEIAKLSTKYQKVESEITELRDSDKNLLIAYVNMSRRSGTFTKILISLRVCP